MVKDIYSMRDCILQAVEDGESVRDVVSKVKGCVISWDEIDGVIAPGDWTKAKDADMVRVTEVEGDGAFRVLFDSKDACCCLEITDTNMLFREADWDTETEEALETTARDWYEDAKSEEDATSD